MEILNLDHLVLTVADIAATCDFYEKLGMKTHEFGNSRKALQFGSQKINLHQKNHEFEPKAWYPTPGSADLCFITNTPLQQVIDELSFLQIEIVKGTGERTGANGRITSVYVRDPDLNLVEISNYNYDS